MATGKYVNIAEAIKPVVAEYANVGGAIVPISLNVANIGDVIYPISVGAAIVFACEQESDRLYSVDKDGVVLWYHWATEWNAGTEYTVGSVASRLGQTYRCILSHTNHNPPNPIYWALAVMDPVDVAADSDGNSYWAGAMGVMKVSPDGEILWTYAGHGTTVHSVCVDRDGNVYSGDLAGVVKKLNSDGVVQWSRTLGASYAVYALAVDYSAGRLYAGTGFAYDAVYSIVTSNGNAMKIWTSPYGDVSGIAVDEGSPVSLYVATNAGYLLRIGLGGFVYWGSGGAISDAVYEVRAGHDGFGYCAAGLSGTYGKRVCKFVLETGSIMSSYAGGGGCAISCAVDQLGNVYGTWYVAGDSAYNVVRRVDLSGTVGLLKWSWQPYSSAKFFGVAVTPGIKAAGF